MKRAADGGAERLDASDGEENARARPESRSGIVRQSVFGVAQHVSPAGCRGLDAEAEEGERRLGEDVLADVEGGGDEDRRGGVRKDVPDDDAEGRGAEGAGGD